MNRTKIEEIDQLLINAFKMGASTGIKGSYVVEVENWLPNFKDANKALLAPLLAEDGGEVKEYSANFLFGFHDNSVEALGYEFANAKTEAYQKEIWTALVEKIASQQAPSANTLSRLERITGLKFATEDEHFKHIEEKLMHLNPAPSAEENPQPTDEERKYFAEHNNSRIIKYAEAPSATVDEPKHLSSEQRQKLFNFLLDSFEIHLLEDEFNTIESIVFPITYPYTLKDEQQPTVDVDVLWEKWKSATMQVNILGDKRDIVFKIAFEHAIQEALRGSYTRQDMIAFLMKYSGLLNPSNRIAKERVSKWLDQYDTERGNSNG